MNMIKEIKAVKNREILAMKTKKHEEIIALKLIKETLLVRRRRILGIRKEPKPNEAVQKGSPKDEANLKIVKCLTVVSNQIPSVLMVGTVLWTEVIRGPRGDEPVSQKKTVRPNVDEQGDQNQ